MSWKVSLTNEPHRWAINLPAWRRPTFVDHKESQHTDDGHQMKSISRRFVTKDNRAARMAGLSIQMSRLASETKQVAAAGALQTFVSIDSARPSPQLAASDSRWGP